MNCWPGQVREVVYVGAALRYHVQLGAETIVVELQRTGLEHRYAPGDTVSVLWRPDDAKLLDRFDG